MMRRVKAYSQAHCVSVDEWNEQHKKKMENKKNEPRKESSRLLLWMLFKCNKCFLVKSWGTKRMKREREKIHWINWQMVVFLFLFLHLIRTSFSSFLSWIIHPQPLQLHAGVTLTVKESVSIALAHYCHILLDVFSTSTWLNIRVTVTLVPTTVLPYL